MKPVCGAYSEPAITKKVAEKTQWEQAAKNRSNCSKENSQKGTNYSSKLVQVLNTKVRCVGGKDLPSPSPNYAIKETQAKQTEGK